EADVLRAWQGLGYYRRARSLHALARAVVEHHAGVLPSDETALRSLPGVGPYTAGALLAFAHDKPGAAVDTNLARIITRVTELPADHAGTVLRDWQAHGSPRAVTSALMDLGA